MTEVESVVKALWQPLISDIKAGGPVFFCYYKDLLGELFAGFSSDDPLEVLNRAANSLLEIDQGGVSLTSTALHPKVDGLSGAIVLVCQQVIAVEEMVKDRSGFSEHAYFPRLRKMISEELPIQSLNPFYSFDEFERIWRKLAQEIRTFEGSSELSITFRFGVEEGINKARSFPLSQALLTRGDLFSIARNVGIKVLKNSSRDRLWNLMRSEKGRLRRRAQNLMGLPFLRDRILDQVQLFTANLDPQKIVADVERHAVENLEMRFYKDSIDWLTEEFRIYLFDPSTSSRIDDDFRIHSLLHEQLSRAGYLILPPSSIGDSWILSRDELPICSGDTFLIVAGEDYLNHAYRVLSSVFKNFAPNSIHPVRFGLSPHHRVAEVNVAQGTNVEFYIRSGKVVNSPQKNSYTYNWIGGLCVDSRGNYFLPDYLPAKIRFSDAEYNLTQVASINGRAIPFEHLRNSINALSDNTVYELQFSGGRKARLGVAIKRPNSSDRMGYSLSSTGVLPVMLDRVLDSQTAIIGFNVPPGLEVQAYPAATCAMLLQELQAGNGAKLNAGDSELVRKRVELALAPDDVKRLIGLLLDTKGQISPQARALFGLDA